MHAEIASCEESRHKCLVYDGHPSEQLPVIVPFLASAITNNWRCLYLGSPEIVQMVDVALRRHGIDTVSQMRRGALVFSSDRVHLSGGAFDPRAMVNGLCESVDNAVRDGFEGLCATGDMRWELGADKNFDSLVEYEALLEQVFRERPLIGICQYHRDVIPARAVRDALITHRTTYVGNRVNRDNIFYMPPEVLLETREGSLDVKHGEWLCQQIIRVINAERERDHALSALAEANRVLEERVKQRTTELEIVNRELESFSYSVSHDLRAPLRAIQSFSDIVAEEAGPALSKEAQKYLDRVRANARHMGDLIDGMLALARVVKADLNRSAIDFTALATEVAQEIQQSQSERTADFVIDDDMWVIGDHALLRSVLANLIGNAWKFTANHPQPRIEIHKTNPDKGFATFLVKDNGAGFEMQYAAQLFTPFQRLHRQDEFPGTGVGLATVRKIILKHGGRIWADSKLNEGATFFFTLAIPASS